MESISRIQMRLDYYPTFPAGLCQREHESVPRGQRLLFYLPKAGKAQGLHDRKSKIVEDRLSGRALPYGTGDFR